MPVDYQLGKIYKITVNKFDEGEEIMTYYGSTCQEYLSSRLSGHIYNYKKYLNDNLNDKDNKYYTSSFQLFDKYGIDNIVIILMENYPCNSKAELEARERYYIENFKCVNKHIPCRTKKEYNQHNIEKIKKYNKIKYNNNKEHYKEISKIKYNDNKDHYKEISKNYHIKNREIVINKMKEYQKEHKDDIKKQKKEYYDKNKDILNEKGKEKFKCDCGSELRKSDKARHLKTEKHQNYMNNQDNQINDI